MRLTILNPGWRKYDAAGNERQIKLSDYISITPLEAHGEWPMTSLLPLENQAMLARWANQEEQRISEERARRRHAIISHGGGSK